MLKKIFLICFLSLMALSFSACNQMKIGERKEATKVTQNSVVQTTPTIINSTPTITVNDKKDQEINKGEILVIEYYTLVGHGVYNDSYSLINPASPQRPSFDQYAEGLKIIYNQLDLKTVEPYAKWAERNGLQELPAYDDIQYFYVELIALSKSETSSDHSSSVEQHIFLKLKKEGDGWTIYSFATNPPLGK